MGFFEPSNNYIIGIASAVVFLLLIQRFLSSVDPHEPPVLNPSPLLIGHILGLSQQRVDFFGNLRLKQRPKTTISTLPMLTTKAYVLWSSQVIQSALRHKELKIGAATLESSIRAFGLSRGCSHAFRAAGPDLSKVLKAALSGESLYKMNVTALETIAKSLNGIDKGDGLAVPNLYEWLTRQMTLAGTQGLFGTANPMMRDPSLVIALWDFDDGFTAMIAGNMPSVFARRAYLARSKLRSALGQYYGQRKDQNDDVSDLIKERARVCREFGFSNSDLVADGLAMLLVATVNSIPTLFWMFVNIWVRPDLVDRLRSEVAPFVKLTECEGGGRGRIGTIDISQIDQCTLLVSVYKETIRLSNQFVGTRRVANDTFLDDEDGAKYLLRKGVDLLWSTKAVHRERLVWGVDADSFNPARFVPQGAGTFEEKRKSMSFIPFGGGRHLCPGRFHAFAENLAFCCIILLGFDVVGLKESSVRADSPPPFGTAVVRPLRGAEGGPVCIRRREKWEDVQWTFNC